LKLLRKFLRHVLVWWLPGLVMLSVLAAGFVFWLAASEHGTRLLLTTAAQQFGGQAVDVRGSLLRGLKVGRLELETGGARVEISGLDLDVRWKALADRLLHVRNLSADSVSVSLPAAQPDEPEETAAGPFTMPALPVKIALDRLALGAFTLTQGGEPLPVSLGRLSASLAAGPNGAQLRLLNLDVGHEAGTAAVSGVAELSAMADPWPFVARLDVAAHGSGPQSPLCEADRIGQVYAAGHKAQPAPAGRGGAAASATSGKSAAAPAGRGQEFVGPPAPACRVLLQADAAGSLDGIQAKLEGRGSGLALDVSADLAPRTPLVIRSVRADARLPDDSSLSAALDLRAQDGGTPPRDGPPRDGPPRDGPPRERLSGVISARRLDLGHWLGQGMPEAVLSLRGDLSADIEDFSRLRAAAVDLRFEDGARWNRQPLSGAFKAALDRVEAPAPAGAADPLAGLWIHGLDADLKLGPNRVRAQGELGQSPGALSLDAQAPRLDAFWPGLPGGAELRGKLEGTVQSHRAELRAGYTPAKARAGVLGEAPAQVELAVAGGWGLGPQGGPGAGLAGWRGTFSRLKADSAGFTVALDRPLAVSYAPDAAAPQWQWQAGQTALSLTLPRKERISLAHQGSRGGGKRWETAGGADNLVITAAMARQIIAAVDPQAAARLDRGPKRVNAMVAENQRRIALDVLWDLKFDGRLAGRVRVARRDGDLLIPGDPPIPLGVRTLALEVQATPASASSSRLDARLNLATRKMGAINGTASAVLAVNAGGGMALDPRQPLRADIDADIADLAWLGLFVGDTMEIGGTLKADLKAQGTLAGKWSATGSVRGEKLRVVRIDDGVRLIDGTLSARLDGDSLVLDSLRFPASLRVMPAEWRTKTWITEDPDAKNGYVEAKGRWNLLQGGGNVRVVLHRFPALQRSDRYAMVSGTVELTAAMPRLDIVGDLKADAGWFSLEILQGVPSLDDDVKVHHPGDEPADASPPLQTSMNLKFDMGPRFYITGMGLDAGLIGAIQIQMRDGRLTGVGALHTRGGGIEAYGQKLRLRRGTLTFQGRLDNPLLDIEALRTGEQVEAGVKVVGTAQRPRIDLVSYPDVSDVEKLSWLLLGRGPDESGSDAALLVSVGTALLGGGQPFYKQFGLDDVSVRTGAIGSSGSILPDRTVAGDVNRDSDSELATQFLVASKSFANGITLSVEQALAGSDTVGRASYRLARGLSLDLKGGSVNGIALVYRTFFGQ